MSTDLTFEAFRRANRQRCEQDYKEPLDDTGDYTAIDWALNVAEEAGEVAGAVLGLMGKKSRHDEHRRQRSPWSTWRDHSAMRWWPAMRTIGRGSGSSLRPSSCGYRFGPFRSAAVPTPAAPLPQGQMAGSGEAVRGKRCPRGRDAAR